MENDKTRLEALKEFGVLDDSTELRFDEIVLLASIICNTPMAALSFIDSQSQHLKAARGLALATVPLHVSPDFDVITNYKNGVLVFSDLSQDSKYSGNPILNKSPRVCFYAGVPVVVDSGLAIGVLSVMAEKPQELSVAQASALKALSSQVTLSLEAQKTRRLLQKSDERFKLAIEGTHEGFLDWNVQTNEVFYSDRWKAMLGFSNDIVENHVDAWRRLIHPEDLGRVLRTIQDYFGETLEVYEIEHRLRTKLGEFKWVLARGTCLRDQRGIPIRLIAWYEDLTERKEQERLAHEQRQKLIYSEKMASLGAMAGEVAHEINNPIAIIHGNAEQLRALVVRGALDHSALLKISDKIESTVQRIVKIVKGLKSFAKDSEGDPFVAVSVKTLVEETLEFCLARFKAHSIDVIYPTVAPDLTVECRPIQISQVLLNLLNNAFDALQDFKEPVKKWVRIDVEAKQDEVTISVVDSGPGIPLSVRKMLMRPFFSTKEAGKGSGLGLSLSRTIIESHCGIFFHDPDSPHTRFAVQIPKFQRKQKKFSHKGDKNDRTVGSNYSRS